MDPILGAAAIQAGAQVGGGLLTMMGQRKREERAMQNQQKLMGLQFSNQMKLNEQGQRLQMDTWEKTNYPAQMKMLKDAGLNPGLLYAKGGSGGVTGSQGGGSASGGNAPAPQQMPNMDIGNSVRTATEILLAKAQARKTNAEANVIETYGGKQAETTIAKMIAETANEETKNKLMNIESDIQEIEKANRQYRITAEVSNIIERTNQLRISNELTQEQFDSIVEETRQKAIGAALENTLTESKIKLTNAERQDIFTTLHQKWVDLGLKDRGLTQEQQKIAIDKLEQEVKQQYPSMGQMTGNIIRNWYHAIRQIDDHILKQTRPDQR